MNVFDKLRAIRDIIQQDVGNRGLARDPEDNLLTATRDDFEDACRSIADHAKPVVGIITGFFVPTAIPPAAETDGPLGSLFLARALKSLGVLTLLRTDSWCIPALKTGYDACHEFSDLRTENGSDFLRATHLVAIERVGPNHTWDSYQQQLWLTSKRAPVPIKGLSLDEFVKLVPPVKQNRCFTMRGVDITEHMTAAHLLFERPDKPDYRPATIGIGDGGNEIGMGKIPWNTIRRNIPNGELVACRVPTDHLIVAGVSNWGAYALGAGVALLRGVELPQELFDPERERQLLQLMVEHGPLVDGVTGKQTATVDGLSWEEYIQPLIEIGRIVRG